MKSAVWLADNLKVLEKLDDASVDLIYIDPPFNTGVVQARSFSKARVVKRDFPIGGRTQRGFGGQRYTFESMGQAAFSDKFDNFLLFLRPRLEHAHRVLKPTGSFYFHIDYREVHYCKVLIDEIFGRENFINEIIWAYDYGGRPKNRWPAKHDNILFYAKDASTYIFNTDEIDRIPYMAPGLVGPEKAARGKLPTDTWWHTIVSPTGKEKLGYPTQKPLPILERIVCASSPKGGVVLDFFAGSGTTGEAALRHERNVLLVDESPRAFEIMVRRLSKYPNISFIENFEAMSAQRVRP